MSELSNLLRQRLGAQNTAENGAGVHPDADTLTAYSEQLLPAPERQRVVKHLSTCADCRDVVALSQVEVPAAEMQPVLKPAPVSLWRKLLAPALGVVGVIAATALIAILITQSPNKPSQSAKNESKAAAPSDQQPAAQPSTSAAPENRAALNEAVAAAPEKDRSARNSSTPVAGLAALAKPSQLPNRLAAPAKTAPPPPPVLTAGLRKQDFVNSAFFEAGSADLIVDGQSTNDYPSEPKPQGYVYDKRLGASAPRQFSDIPQNQANSKSTLAILNPLPPIDHFGSKIEKTVIKGTHAVLRSPFSSPAISSNGLGSRAMLASPKFDPRKAEQSAAVAAAPSARADTDSFGFASSGAMSGAARSSLSSAETSAASWKVAEGKLLKAFGQSPWEEARTGAPFEFTFVNARAGEVWAGGTNAGLIHSYDGGNTWNLVKLGEGASGSIVNIFFAGNHVQVKTSDDQSWSTSDGGKSWTRN